MRSDSSLHRSAYFAVRVTQLDTSSSGRKSRRADRSPRGPLLPEGQSYRLWSGCRLEKISPLSLHDASICGSHWGAAFLLYSLPVSASISSANARTMRTETRAPLRSMSLDPLGRRGGRIGGSDLNDPCIRLLHAPERPLPMRRWRPFRHKRSNRWGGGAGAGTKPQGMGLVPSATPRFGLN